MSDEKVYFIISVFYNDKGSPCYTLSNWLVKELNETINSDKMYVIFVSYPENEGAPVVELRNASTNNCGIYSEIFYNETVEITSLNPDIYVYDLETLQALRTSNTPGSDYLMYNQGYHVSLNTNYKLVSQGNLNCAMACIASIYRYRTNTTAMDMAMIYEFVERIMSFPYGTTDGQVGLLNYLMYAASPYAHYTGHITHFLAMHNLNNGYPFIMGAAYYDLNGTEHQHTFMIRGYQYTQGTYSNVMKYEYFNPWGYVEVTGPFSNGASIIFSSGGKTWYELNDHCLQYPGYNY